MVARFKALSSRRLAHSGFVGLVGRPNVGKSTLVNQLARRKLSIVTDKPQTTRHQIRVIVNADQAQAIIIDTPGFHKPKDGLGRRLNQKVKSTMAEVDTILFILDAEAGIGRGDQYIARELQGVRTPVLVAVNKIDTIMSAGLQEQVETAAGLLGRDTEVLPISAKTGKGIGQLLDRLISLLPEGPRFYPPGVSTDQPEAVLIAEFIREKIIDLTKEEVPYAVAVEVQELRKRSGRDLIDVFVRIYVERESQKGIVIGRGGQILEQVGKSARSEIESLLGSQVYLDLRVKVAKDWREKENKVEEFGY